MKRPAIVVFPALALVFSVGCADAATHGGSPAAPPVYVTASVQGAQATNPPPKGSVAGSALAVLATIRIARENPAGYQRTKFRHWVDADGDGCNTREEVLIAESTSKAQVMWPGCKVIEGDWISRYDGVAVTDPADLDIDHFVPLKESWDSGAFAWTSSQREQFANDLSDPRALVAVTASTNRSKGDKDPPQWMPLAGADFCPYLSDWVAVKARWRLSMDESEYRFIEKRLKGQCAGTTIAAWGSAPTSGQPTGAGLVTTLPASISPAPATVPPVTTAAGPDTTLAPSETAKGSLPTIKPGAFCSPKGANGTYGGKAYVCSDTKATGEPYAGGRAHWRQA